MTITLTLNECSELWAEPTQNSTCNKALEPFEFLWAVPRQLGKGYTRDIEVHPSLCLSIFEIEHHDDVLIKFPVGDHPLQFGVLLSGRATNDYGQVGGEYTLISGNGIQRKMTLEIPKSQRIIGVTIHMPPELLTTFFSGEDGQISPQLNDLAKGNDWQTLLYPQSTTAIHSVAQQIVHCPYRGMTKRMYLLSKVLELITLQLAPILADRSELTNPPRLKTQTIARIHHAREILLSRLENPPSLPQLATLVGVSDRTLRRGFQEVFGTTVFGYLTDKRMVQAEQFLREGNRSVCEVANIVGYSHLGQFAAVFKRKFGITPSECLVGNKSGLR